MIEELNKRFLAKTEHSGRYIIQSLVTGKKYYVEPIDNTAHRQLWGDINTATDTVEGEYGKNYKGAINEKESLITKENGFDKIYNFEPGESPNDYILRLDKEYEIQNNIKK